MANRDIIINSDYTIETKIFAFIMTIANEMQVATAKVLKKYDLSKTQLDILHCLHFAKSKVLTVKQIKEQMVEESPNVSRSLNKLMENGYIEKERTLVDQRVVKVYITAKGKKVHYEADMAILNEGKSLNLSEEEKEVLYSLLQKI